MLMTEQRGRLFVLSGPSGSGKDTILMQYLEDHPEICFSISCVTRALRSNERDGEKYHFISREAFLQLVEQDEMLEYAEYCGNYYGTPRGPIEQWLSQGRDVIVEVDVQGAASIRSKMPEAVLIFVMPPSMEVLKKRLIGRQTEEEEVALRRLHAAVREIECAKRYDYIVVNDELECAVGLFEAIIDSEKAKTAHMMNLIDEVLRDAEPEYR